MKVETVYCSKDVHEILSNNILSANEIRIATGYFSYKIFELFKNELNIFTNKNGKFRLLIGSDTNDKSIAFIKSIKDLSKNEFLEELSKQYFKDFKDISDEGLKCAFNLFNKNIIEIKIGISAEGIFHVKEYLFENLQDNNYISGSLNFTKQAILYNHESVQHFTNYDNYRMVSNFFDKRWNDCIGGVDVVGINSFLSKMIKKEANMRNVKLINNSNMQLRPYQEEAIELLINEGLNGFLEMATGTGKTFTTIQAISKFLSNKNEKYFSLVVVPLQHLASQWKEEIVEIFGKGSNVIECHSGKNWKSQISKAVEKSEYDNVFCVMVSNSFFNNLNDINKLTKYSNNILIIDEAHNLTKDNIKSMKEESLAFSSRVGLSATPTNYLDDERTRLMFDFFKGAHYKFSLEKAISEGFLTKYKYYPVIVELELDEENEYKRLDNLIKSEVNTFKRGKLLDDRSDVLSRARNKINELIRVINKVDNLEYALVYCSPGFFLSSNNIRKRYIDQVSIDLEEQTNLGLKKRKITSNETIEQRKSIVKDFESRKIDMILAIKCLDEGYNIPAVKNAFILHSTRNPSEFIQRRGRVLRKFKGKEMAYIYDFIVSVKGVIPVDEKIRFDEYYKLSDNVEELKYFKNKYIGDYEYEQ